MEVGVAYALGELIFMRYCIASVFSSFVVLNYQRMMLLVTNGTLTSAKAFLSNCITTGSVLCNPNTYADTVAEVKFNMIGLRRPDEAPEVKYNMIGVDEHVEADDHESSKKWENKWSGLE